jgi:Na+-translocating ferredoxin:NAD+ oxidoreductase RNF subunit RnfB
MSILIARAVNWASVGVVLGIVAGLAVIFAVLILIVTKVCHVHEDEKVLKILEHLAGANCGGCGHTGCEDFAKCLACGKAELNDCKATSNEDKAAIAAIADLPFAAEEATVAVVRCSGGDLAADKFDYIGNPGCLNQMVYQGGRKICATACLGGGTCQTVCPVDAVSVRENGIAFVRREICLSCGACINACPKHCIDRIPASAKVYVACRTHCKGKETMSFCKMGCIGCGLCARFCPEHAITMVDNLPIIDYAKCTGCLTCVSKCPRHCIKRTDDTALPEKEIKQ